jgi:hypothetical protein
LQAERDTTRPKYCSSLREAQQRNSEVLRVKCLLYYDASAWIIAYFNFFLEKEKLSLPSWLWHTYSVFLPLKFFTPMRLYVKKWSEEVVIWFFSTLQALEISKARLRSRATYSPLETILQKAVQNYLDEPCFFSQIGADHQNSSSIIRKTYGPTFL